MTIRTLESLGSLAGKTVIIRCDLNVPLKDGVITDDGRIRASLGTLNTLIEAGAKLVVISHLGRPDGTPDDPVRPDGYLRPNWATGGWSTNPERLGVWAQLASRVAELQHARLTAVADRPG